MRSLHAADQVSWEARLNSQRADLKAFWMAAFSGVVMAASVNLFTNSLSTLLATDTPPHRIWFQLALWGALLLASLAYLLYHVRPGWLREDIEVQLAIPIAVEPGNGPTIPVLHGAAHLGETLYHLVRWAAQNRDKGPVCARVAATFDDPNELTAPALSWAMPWLLQALVYHEVAALSHKTLGKHGDYSRWFPVKAAHGGEVREISRDELTEGSDNSLLTCPSLKQSAMLPARLQLVLPPLGGVASDGDELVLLRMRARKKAEVVVTTRREISFWREGQKTYEAVRGLLKSTHHPETSLRVVQQSLCIHFQYRPSWAAWGRGDREAARFRWWTEVCRTLVDDLDIECIQARADKTRP